MINKLVAGLIQKKLSLTSAAETFDLQAADSASEIQKLLQTQFPTHFADLLHTISHSTSTTGIVHIFKTIGSGLLAGFKTFFGTDFFILSFLVLKSVWGISYIPSDHWLWHSGLSSSEEINQSNQQHVVQLSNFKVMP